jgi:hypothetical protein
MRKFIFYTAVVAVAIFGMLPGIVLGSSGFTVSPARLEVTVPESDSRPAYVYITSYFDGELIVGTESIPFRVEPETIPVSSTDRYKKVELLIYGDPAVEEGEYTGKLTFLALTGKNVAFGIKVDIFITQTGEKSPIKKFISRIGEQASIDKLIEATGKNYVFIIAAVVVVLVALVIGILIGRKSRNSSRKRRPKSDDFLNGEDE